MIASDTLRVTSKGQQAYEQSNWAREGHAERVQTFERQFYGELN